jgi:hypothetical protein
MWFGLKRITIKVLNKEGIVVKRLVQLRRNQVFGEQDALRASQELAVLHP